MLFFVALFACQEAIVDHWVAIEHDSGSDWNRLSFEEKDRTPFSRAPLLFENCIGQEDCPLIEIKVNEDQKGTISFTEFSGEKQQYYYEASLKFSGKCKPFAAFFGSKCGYEMEIVYDGESTYEETGYFEPGQELTGQDTPRIFQKELHGSNAIIRQSCTIRFDEMMCANTLRSYDEKPDYCSGDTTGDPACDGFDGDSRINQLFFGSKNVLEKYDFSLLMEKINEE